MENDIDDIMIEQKLNEKENLSSISKYKKMSKNLKMIKRKRIFLILIYKKLKI